MAQWICRTGTEKVAPFRNNGLKSTASRRTKSENNFVLVVVLFLLLGTCIGCGGKTLDGDEGVNALKLVGKSQKEVIKVLGKPDYVFDGGSLTDGRSYSESWEYENQIRHKATGKKQNLKIFFVGEEVIAWSPN